MGRPALQPEEISEFRERLCGAALRLFADRGYEGFTLRALGHALDCSPTTPYRYFEDKQDIFQAVCAHAFEELCAAQEAGRAAARGSDAWEGIRAQGRSYVSFARSHPHAYRVMFDLRSSASPRSIAPHYLKPIHRSWHLLRDAFQAAHDASELDGDPTRLAASFWASLHGVMSLELGNRLLIEGSADDLVEDVFDRFQRAYRPATPSPNGAP